MVWMDIKKVLGMSGMSGALNKRIFYDYPNPCSYSICICSPIGISIIYLCKYENYFYYTLRESLNKHQINGVNQGADRES